MSLMIRPVFRDYITKELGFTDAQLEAAYKKALAKSESTDCTVIEVITRDILQGRDHYLDMCKDCLYIESKLAGCVVRQKAGRCTYKQDTERNINMKSIPLSTTDRVIRICQPHSTLFLIAHECEDSDDAVDKVTHDWPELAKFIKLSSSQLYIKRGDPNDN